MYIPLIILGLQTFVCWLIVFLLYRAKEKLTLIPLYSYIAILTILTHNFSDLEFAVKTNGWFFLISSFAFFTTLMFGTLYLYLLEGPRAARTAFGVILFASFFYVGTVYLTGLETNVANWIKFDGNRVFYYFWSLLAIVADIIFLAVAWELLSKIKKINLLIRLFLIILAVLVLDTLIFTTGFFGREDFYFTMLKGNLIIRLILSLVAALVIGSSLKLQGFKEEKREKPKNFWEIVNFRSDLENRILTLEEAIAKQKNLEKQLKETEETYRLAISGTGAGIWDWDVVTNKVIWSPKFCLLLGYKAGEIRENLDAFREILHPEDLDRTFKLLEDCFKTGKPYEIEYRLKTKDGKYRWFMASGIVKYDGGNKPVRMVGSVIDINDRKEAEITIKEKIGELTSINNLMAGRELKMIELKNEIAELKKNRI